MTISHHVTGDGPPVLLVHAGVADARMWQVQVDELRRDHRVVAPDLRGYGRTPLEAGASYSDAGDLLDLLDGLGIDRIAAVGASYGAQVVLQAASRAPERFSRLVLISPPVSTVARTSDLLAFGAEEDRLLAAGDVTGATALNVRTWLGPEAGDEARELVRRMQQQAFELQLAAGDEVTNEDYEVRPERIRCPVRLITGAHDLAFFHDSAHYLEATLPDVRHLRLDWAGHLPGLERPQEIATLLRNILALGA